MRLDEIGMYVRTISLLGIVSIPATRHQIAKNISSKSRSTVYRDMTKLHDMGVVSSVSDHKEKKIYMRVTQKGLDLADAMRELM